MSQISEHISYTEATFSLTAKRLGIDNTPNPDQLQNMKELAENVFEPLREALGNNPIHISSFFRCQKLNKVVGGAINSQHVALNGSAMDIQNESNPSNKEIFDYIKWGMEFDQLICEFPDKDGNPSWVHVSWNAGNNRKNILVSKKVNGRTIYENYNNT